MTDTTNHDLLSATVSFRVTEAECRALMERAHRAERSVSNFVRQQLHRLLEPRELDQRMLANGGNGRRTE